MLEYLVPYAYGEDDFTEKKSVFIGRVWPCTSEEDAIEQLGITKKAMHGATHNVYAYSIQGQGVTRFSDDGEPHGTAGLPVLNVFEREEISDYLCIVTRYFGGTLLGTGGLARAYSHAAKIALEKAGKAAMKPVSIFSFSCPYSLFEQAKILISDCGGNIDLCDYGADISIKLWTPIASAEGFIKSVSELSAGSIKLTQEDTATIKVKI